jgi:hypothetical protein
MFVGQPFNDFKRSTQYNVVSLFSEEKSLMNNTKSVLMIYFFYLFFFLYFESTIPRF